MFLFGVIVISLSAFARDTPSLFWGICRWSVSYNGGMRILCACYADGPIKFGACDVFSGG